MKPEEQDDSYWDGADDDQQTGQIQQNDRNAYADEAPVTWSAVEYIDSQKGFVWYVLFVVVALGLAAAGYFLMNAITFSVLVVVMAAAVIVFSRRPARTIQYTLSGKQGLYVGEKLYHFGEFKAFGLLHEDGHNSIMLIPTKRFGLGVSVYFPEEAGEDIVDILGARLPMKELKLDVMDKLIRRLRL
jgi:hypothetical protein